MVLVVCERSKNAGQSVLTEQSALELPPVALSISTLWSIANRSADGILCRSLMMAPAAGAARGRAWNTQTAWQTVLALAASSRLAPRSSNA